MEVIIYNVRKLVAQISDGKLQLGGLFDFLKVDVEKYKDVIEQFGQLDLESPKFTNDQDGTANWNAIAEAIGDADDKALSYFKTLDDGNGKIQNQSASVKGMSAYLKETGQSFNFASIKATLFNTALNAGIAFLATATIQAISKLATASEDIREQIKEVSEEFKNTSSEIQDYKTRIEELYSTINDSGSSIEDVTTARKDLLVVQDELIDKFGDEESAINNITAAINGQTEALDTLTKDTWQEYKNKFNKSNFGKDASNWLLGYSDNIDKMLNEYGNYSVDLQPQDRQDKNRYDMDAFTDEIINELKRRGYDEENIIDTSKKTVPNAPSSDMKVLRLKGTANEVHEMVTTIQNIADDMGWDFADSFDKALVNAANNSDELIGKYKEAYDQYVLYEEIFKNEDYVNSFKKLQDAYAEYQKSFTSGDQGKIEEATEKYANVLSEALTNADGNEMVIDYFSNMYPDLKKVVDNWKFETKIIPTLYTDSLKGKTKNIFK